MRSTGLRDKQMDGGRQQDGVISHADPIQELNYSVKNPGVSRNYDDPQKFGIEILICRWD